MQRCQHIAFGIFITFFYILKHHYVHAKYLCFFEGSDNYKWFANENKKTGREEMEKMLFQKCAKLGAGIIYIM